MFCHDSVILFYVFHFLYLGYPSVILEWLWTTWQAVEDSNGTNRAQDKGRWKAFIDTMKETFQSVSMMVSTCHFLGAQMGSLEEDYSSIAFSLN